MSLRTLIRKKNMTQKDVAEAAGFTQAAMSRYVNGSRNMRIDTLYKIARVLDVSMNELFEEVVNNGREV